MLHELDAEILKRSSSSEKEDEMVEQLLSDCQASQNSKEKSEE